MDFRYHSGLASVFTIDGKQGLYRFTVFNTAGLAQFSTREQGIRDKHPYSDSLWRDNLRPKEEACWSGNSSYTDSVVTLGMGV
jgi:hypothetical protein